MGYFGELYYPDSKRIFTGEPIEDMKTTAAALESKYQTAKQGKDQLDILASNINTLDDDYAIKKAAIDKIRGGFKDFEEEGNWEMANSTLSGEYKDLVTNQGLTLAKGKYDTRAAYMQDLKEQRGELGWTEDELNEYVAASDRLGSTPVSFYDPLTKEPLDYNADTKNKGMWKGSYNGYIPGKKINLVAKLDEALKGFAADTYGSSNYGKSANGDYYVVVNGTEKKVSESDILSYGKSYFASDPETQRYFADLDYIRNAKYELSGTTDATLQEIATDLQSFIGVNVYDASDAFTQYSEEEAFAQLNEIQDYSQEQLNYVANQLKTQMSLQANANKSGYIEQKPNLKLTANWRRQADYAHSLETQVPNIIKTRDALKVPALVSSDTSSLGVALTNSKDAIDNEFKAFLETYNESGFTDLTYNGLKQYAIDKGISVADAIIRLDNANVLNTVRDNMGVAEYNKLNTLVDNYEILQQREKDANNQAAKDLGFTSYEQMLKSKDNINIRYNTPTVQAAKDKIRDDYPQIDYIGDIKISTSVPDGLEVYNKDGDFIYVDASHSLNLPNIITKYDGNKFVSNKNQYLKETSEGAIQTMTIGTLMPGATEEEVQSRTEAIQNYFKNPANIVTLTAYAQDGEEGELRQIKDIVPPKKDGTYKVSMPHISLTPEGDNQEHTITATVIGKDGVSKDVIIPVSQIPSVRKWVNAPTTKLNTWLLNSFKNSVTERTITTSDGGVIKIKFPIYDKSKELNNSKFYNDGDFIIDVKTKSGARQIESGESAFDVLNATVTNNLIPSIYKTNN